MLNYAKLHDATLYYTTSLHYATLHYTTLYVACVHFLAVGGLFSVIVYVSAHVFGCV